MRAGQAKALKIAAVAAGLIALLVVARQLRREPPPPPPVSGEFRLGLALQPTSALALVAAELGLFERENAGVRIVEYPSGKLAMDGLLAGEIDAATMAEVPFVFASFARSDIRVVAAINHAADIPRVVANADSGIRAAADLRGKRIATQRASAVHYYLYLLLMKEGLSTRDARLVFMAPGDLPGALEAGEIDAFCMREPYVSEGVRRLGEKAVVLSERGLAAIMELLVVAEPFLEAHPRRAEAALRALIAAADFARERPGEAAAIVARRLRAPLEHVEADWESQHLAVSLDQGVFQELENVARWAIGEGLAEAREVPNYLRLVEETLLEKVKPQAVTIVR